MVGSRQPSLFVFLLAGIIASLASCSPVYVARAGIEEAGILLRRKPIARVIADSRTSDATREKLQLVLNARDYAEHLGLNAGKSYTKYSQVDREVLSWVVSAAQKTQLKAYTWWYPIIGSVPYKGFFTKPQALHYAKGLERRGYDTFVRPSIAYSTLGWFNDPVLSSQLTLDHASLVNMVIHELVHSTVWIPGSVTFNETFANIFAGVATIDFFHKYTTRYPEMKDLAEKQYAQELAIGDFLDSLLPKLRSLYERDITDNEKLRLREDLFSTWQNAFARSFPKPTNKKTRKQVVFNNARILAYDTYLHKTAAFVALYTTCGRDLGKMLKYVQLLARSTASEEQLFEKLYTSNCFSEQQTL